MIAHGADISIGNVPQKYPPNEKLGIWVNKQRMEKKAFDERADRTSMTQRKIDALNSIGFTWAKRKGDVSWNEKFRALQEYRSVHGNCKRRKAFASRCLIVISSHICFNVLQVKFLRSTLQTPPSDDGSVRRYVYAKKGLRGQKCMYTFLSHFRWLQP